MRCLNKFGLKHGIGSAFAGRYMKHNHDYISFNNIGTIQIERAHRTGAPTTTQRERTVVVKVALFKDHDTIIWAAWTVKLKGVFDIEDFFERMISQQKELLPDMREAHERSKHFILLVSILRPPDYRCRIHGRCRHLWRSLRHAEASILHCYYVQDICNLFLIPLFATNVNKGASDCYYYCHRVIRRTIS